MSKQWWLIVVASCISVLLVLVYQRGLPTFLLAASTTGGSTAPHNFSRRTMTDADLKVEGGLDGAIFVKADLGGLLLDGLPLRRAVFTGASLRGSSLVRARLQGSDFTGADLRSADFTGADLSGADLSGACLRGARFDRAVLTGVLVRGTSYDPGSQFQTALSPPLVPAGATLATVSAAVPPATAEWCV